MAEPLWFTPVCDQVLAKVARWKTHYDRGEVHSTRKFNHPVQGVIDLPVCYAHRLAFTKAEFDHLVRIMEACSQDKALIEELILVRDKILPNGRLMPGNVRVITLAFFLEHVTKIYDTLLEAKNGKPRSIGEYQEPGKGLFE